MDYHLVDGGKGTFSFSPNYGVVVLYMRFRTLLVSLMINDRIFTKNSYDFVCLKKNYNFDPTGPIRFVVNKGLHLKKLYQSHESSPPQIIKKKNEKKRQYVPIYEIWLIYVHLFPL